PTLIVLNQMDAAKRRGIRIDREALAAELGVPVLETVAVKRHGAAELLAALDAPLPSSASREFDATDGLHTRVRDLLRRCVEMPERTARIDEQLDRVLLHPLYGLLILAVVMFCIFQAVFSWASPLSEGIDAGTAWL
ncbi:FeoB small GTPase domain-containing protein, partial [Vogesella mureinivorans]|uniref:FeoB small GTPase domain-containing protein n=1 Tax=Vogesella mureinivorans TaxID=657276 RepID=UPI0023EF562B